MAEIAQLCETIMMICFGLSWPFNIVRSYRARSAKGKSVGAEVLTLVGYTLGIAGKFIGGNITYVLAVYIVDLAMVAIDLALTLRNVALDRMEERKVMV